MSDGDWLIANVTIRANESFTATPSGWTAIYSNNQSGFGTNQSIFVKYISNAAGEAGTYTWSWTTSVKYGITITSISGAAPTNIYDAITALSQATGSGSGSVSLMERIWTRKTSGLAVCCYSTSGGNVTYTLNGSYTSRGTNQSGTSSGPDVRFGVGTKDITGAIPSAVNHSLSTPRNNGTVHVLFRSASTPLPYAIRSWRSTGNTSSASSTAVLPSIWGPGDLHVVVQSCTRATSAASFTPASGYTQIGSTITKNNSGNTANVSQALIVRVLQAGDTQQNSSWTATPGATCTEAVVVSLGDDGAVALNTLADTTDNSTFDFPSLTLEASTQETWLFASVAINRSTGPGIPSGFSRFVGPVQLTPHTNTLDWKANTAANPGSGSSSAGNTGVSTGIQFAIRPKATRMSRVFLFS